MTYFFAWALILGAAYGFAMLLSDLWIIARGVYLRRQLKKRLAEIGGRPS